MEDAHISVLAKKPLQQVKEVDADIGGHAA